MSQTNDTNKALALNPLRKVVAGASANTSIAVVGLKKGDTITEVLGYKGGGTDDVSPTAIVDFTATSAIYAADVLRNTADTTGYKLVVKWRKARARPKGVVSIDVTPSTSTKAAAATQQLAVVATYDDGSTLDVTHTASYTTSAASKATVNRNGLITAVATGSATITATYGGQTDTCAVTVS